MSTGLDGEDPLESHNKESQQAQTMCIIFHSFPDPQLGEHQMTLPFIHNR